MTGAGRVAAMVSAATEAEGGFVFTGKHAENLDFDGVSGRRGKSISKTATVGF
jgi:hypothetical protein